MDSKVIAQLAAKAMDDKKAREISILELKERSLLTDYFVLANGASRTQTQAIADNVEEELEKVGIKLTRREGYPEGRWVLLDFGFIIVHIFQEEERLFYNLERLWGDAPRLRYED